jgi:hypothetical protein
MTIKYKFLDEYGKDPLQLSDYILPKGNSPGGWMPEIENIKMNEVGYHLCPWTYLLHHVDARLFEVRVPEGYTFKDRQIVTGNIRLEREITEWNRDFFKEFILKFIKNDYSEKDLELTPSISPSYLLWIYEECLYEQIHWRTIRRIFSFFDLTWGELSIIYNQMSNDLRERLKLE